MDFLADLLPQDRSLFPREADYSGSKMRGGRCHDRHLPHFDAFRQKYNGVSRIIILYIMGSLAFAGLRGMMDLYPSCRVPSAFWENGKYWVEDAPNFSGDRNKARDECRLGRNNHGTDR